MIPLVANHGIKSGPIDDKSALQSIDYYYPVMTSWLSGVQSSTHRDENVQLKCKILTEDQPNLVKSGSFQLQIVTELDAYDDPNHPIYDINKLLEERITKNNK